MKRTNKIDKCIGNLEAIKSEIEEFKDNLQDQFDSKSEKWQEGEKGEEMQGNISRLEDLLNELESAYSSMEDLFELE